MNIDFSAKILDMDGSPIKDGDREFTLGTAVSTALLASYPDEKELSGKEKVERFHIAEAAYAGGAKEMSVENLSTVKKLVARAYGPLIVGRVYGLIESA